MTPAEAEAVRATVWTESMRRDYGPWRHMCACEYGATAGCHMGDHHLCHHGNIPTWLAIGPETWITDANGYLLDTGGGARGGPTCVWVTGCCASWRCRCGCHTEPSEVAT